MKIYEPGSPVRIGFNDMHGTVVSVMIEPKEHISYKIGWWSGRDYKTEWFHENQIKPASMSFGHGSSQDRKIGFHQ